MGCFRTGAVVQCDVLSLAADRWPLFAPAARESGYSAVCALPMRLRERVIGAMNLFNAAPGALDAAEVELGRALADVATIRILQERAVRRSEEIAGQLQGALDSRVLIEQAKSTLAQRLGISVDQAFAALRSHARSTNSKITEVAVAVVSDRLPISAPASPQAGPAQPT